MFLLLLQMFFIIFVAKKKLRGANMQLLFEINKCLGDFFQYLLYLN